MLTGSNVSLVHMHWSSIYYCWCNYLQQVV